MAAWLAYLKSALLLPRLLGEGFTNGLALLLRSRLAQRALHQRHAAHRNHFPIH